MLYFSQKVGLDNLLKMPLCGAWYGIQSLPLQDSLNMGQALPSAKNI